jgi:hypothetical protein
MKRISQPKPTMYFQVTCNGPHWIAPTRFFLTRAVADTFSREKLEWISELIGQPVAKLRYRFTTLKVNVEYHPETPELLSVYHQCIGPSLTEAA